MRFTRITKAPNYWKQMVVFPQEKEWNTSNINIVLLMTKLTRAILVLFTVHQPLLLQKTKCGPMCSLNKKNSRLFLEDISVLMNLPVNYVDNGEFDGASDENKPEEFIFATTGGSHIIVQ